MSIWHKILIAFIFLTIPFNFFFTCRTLKTHQVWRDLIAKNEKDLAQWEEKNHKLEFGQIDEKTGEVIEKGTKQYESDLAVAMFRRGRAWFGARVDAKDVKTGSVVLDITEPTPHKIQPGTILYCFSAQSAGEIDEKYQELGNVCISDAYVGKFTVAQVEDTKIRIVPSMDMTMSAEGQPLQPNPYLADKLEKARGTWNLYEKMPCDEHDMFLTMEADEIREALPESSVAEYLVEDDKKDGKDGSDSSTLKYNQERKLRDYERIFDSISANLTKLDNLILVTKYNLERVQVAVQETKAFCETQQNLHTQISEQKDRVTKERDAVAEHLKALASHCSQCDTRIQQLTAEIGELVKSIEKSHREAARRIRERGQQVLEKTETVF